MRSLVKHILARFRRNPLASDPQWCSLDRQERDARRRHASVRDIQAAKRARVHQGLKGAVGR